MSPAVTVSEGGVLATFRAGSSGPCNAAVRGVVPMHAGVYTWSVTCENVGGTFSDVGICTGDASLHRGDYEALLG
jgi:hypothetical protein